jgi:O-antigen/teichoic acid export membrane protein
LIANVISIALTPVISRLYEPETIGIYTSIMALTSIVSVIISRKSETLIPMTKSKLKATELFMSNIISSIFYLLALNLLFILINYFGIAVKNSTFEKYIFEINAISIVLVIYANVTYFNIKNFKFDRIQSRNWLQPISVIAIQIVLAVKHPNTQSLLIAEALGRIISFTKSLPEIIRLMFAKIKLGKLINHKTFTVPKTFSYFLFEAIYSTSMLIFIFTKFGENAAGQFALAFRISMAPTALIGVSVGQYFVARVGKSRSRRSLIIRMQKEFSWFFKLLPVIIFLIFFIFGGLFLSPILGQNYALSGKFLVSLSIFSATNLLFIIYIQLALFVKGGNLTRNISVIKSSIFSIACITCLALETSSVNSVLVISIFNATSDLICIKMIKSSLNRL